MNLDSLTRKLIPPNDYQHRNGFTNEALVDKLTLHQRGLVEEVLIHQLEEGIEDMLIVETLAYMQSTKSLPVLTHLLEQPANPMQKIIVARSIYKLNKDGKMVQIATEAFNALTDTYDKIRAFYYLSGFKSLQTDGLIEAYMNHEEYLLAYNAKRALETFKNQEPSSRKRPWWKFWLA